MKTFRLIGMALLAVVMCVSFTSCSDDDESDVDSNSIVGFWKIADHDDDFWDYQGDFITEKVAYLEFTSSNEVYPYNAKLLQKSEMRKDIVIELSYKGFG